MGEAKRRAEHLLKLQAPTEKHFRVRNMVMNAIRGELADVPEDEVLAVLAYTLGQVIALQDQRKRPAAAVMDLVAQNIEAGNKHAVDSLALAPAAGSA